MSVPSPTLIEPRMVAPTNPLRVSAAKVPLLLAATLAAACDQATSMAGGGDLATTFDTRGGVVHVTNTGTPKGPRLGFPLPPRAPGILLAMQARV